MGSDLYEPRANTQVIDLYFVKIKSNYAGKSKLDTKT